MHYSALCNRCGVLLRDQHKETKMTCDFMKQMIMYETCCEFITVFNQYVSCYSIFSKKVIKRSY